MGMFKNPYAGELNIDGLFVELQIYFHENILSSSLSYSSCR